MRFIKQFIIICLLSSLIVVPNSNSSKEDNSDDSFATICFSLNSYTEQTITYYNDQGQKIVLTIEPISFSNSQGSKVDNGTYKISAASPLLSLYFFVQIQNQNIISVTEGGWSSTYYTVTGGSAAIITNKKATYRLNCLSGIIEMVKWVYCTINSNNEIVITNNL